MKHCLTGLAIALVLCTDQTGAADTNREYQSHTFTNDTLHVQISNGKISFLPLIGNAVEVVFQPLENASVQPSYALAGNVPSTRSELNETDERLVLTAGELVVDIQKDPFAVNYKFQERALTEEEQGYVSLERGAGFRFKLNEEEIIYGAGSRALGRMNRRGERFELYNSACYSYEYEARLMYYSMPAIVSSRKYMLVFDNAARGHVDIDSKGDGILEFGAVGGRMAYILIAGGSWEDLANNIAITTGRQPMLPRWALGHIASRMGYHTQEEVERVVARHIAEDIPIDAVVLDLFWFGPSIFGTMGNLDWDRDAFPEPVGMMDRLREQGVKTILITEPLILKESVNWESAKSNQALAVTTKGEPYTFNSFFGEAALIDMFSPIARDWMWTYYKKHTSSGVAGWWGDLGEPETHPDDIQHVSGRGEELHNAFGHHWAGLVYEGYRKDFPDQRPFILMRSGFAGTQRFGILPWSGDVKRSWGGFRPQVELSLQMGLQGIAYMHSDLGGFTGENHDPELYTRWMQYGTFQPIYRPHGHEEVSPEPIYWDEQTKCIVREYIKLRYRLLPYNYTLMYENSVYGKPLMRPLMYLEDSRAMQESLSAYLWGESLLVAPVLEPGVEELDVPLPANSTWFDFWSGKRYDGGRVITVPVSRDNIPVFVKAGSFIPMTKALQNTDEYDGSELIVHYYADASIKYSEGIMYDDDGISPDAYASGKYELIYFLSSRADDRLKIRVYGTGYDYPGKPAFRAITLVIHGLEDVPGLLVANGKDETAYSWDNDTGLLSLEVLYETETIEIVIHNHE